MALSAMILFGAGLIVVGLFARAERSGPVAVPAAAGSADPTDGVAARTARPAATIGSASDLGALLESLPYGIVVEDARLEWPGPELSIRGHTRNLAGRDDALGAWGRRSGGAGWFRRLEPSDDDSLLVFEYRMTSPHPIGEGEPPSPDAAQDPVAPRAIYNPDWDSLVVGLSSEDVRLVTLSDRTTARWTVAYRGERKDLCEAFDRIRARGIPVRRLWLGHSDSLSGDEWEMRLRLGLASGTER
jgi:hypothetical protein